MTEHPQPIPPGATIVDELKVRGWSVSELALRSILSLDEVEEIIAGTRRIGVGLACHIAGAFGTTAKFWLALERNYRKQLAESKAKPGS